MRSLSEAQKISLALLPKISSLLSMLGSAWIILDISCDREKQKQLYHQLFWAFSSIILMSSTFMFLGTWPIGEDKKESVAWSKGNAFSCKLLLGNINQSN